MPSAYIIDNGAVYEIPCDTSKYSELVEFTKDALENESDNVSYYGTNEQCVGKICSQEIRKELDDEYKSEIESMKRKLSHFEELKASEIDFNDKKRALEADYQKKLTQMREELLSNALQKVHTPLYCVKMISEMPPKCDACDSNRQISFTSPYSGKSFSERCPYCGSAIYRYEVSETEIITLMVSNSMRICDVGKNGRSGIRFRVAPSSNKSESWYMTVNEQDIVITVPKDWSEYSNTSILFENRFIAQKYCDWLNSEITKLEQNNYRRG